jgi:hypothetical protein
MKIRPVAIAVVCADRRTGLRRLIVAFCNCFEKFVSSMRPEENMLGIPGRGDGEIEGRSAGV